MRLCSVFKTAFDFLTVACVINVLVMVALLLLLSLTFIISQGLQRRLNLSLPGFVWAWGQVFVSVDRVLTIIPFSHLCNGVMSPDELLEGSAVPLSLTPHLAGSSWPAPLLASPHAGHNRNSLVPSSSLHHSHFSQLYFLANYLVVRAPNAT